MSLSDRERLELDELCHDLVDGTLDAAGRERLQQMLGASEAARRHYARCLALSSSLMQYASEMQTGAATPAPAPVRAAPWAYAALAAAAALAFGLWLLPRLGGAAGGPGDIVDADTYVARVSAEENCRWTTPPPPNGHLPRGHRLALASGRAEITFDCGATVVLEGPADLELNSPWDATLHRGMLKADVPPEAVGFRVDHSSVEVVDLGTEFAMVADPDGAAEVYVLKGKVEARARAAAGVSPFVLREAQSRRFTRASVSEVADPARRLAHLARAAPTAPARLGRYLRCRFDAASETDGVRDFRVEVPRETVPADGLGEGRWGQGLELDGSWHARANLPDLALDRARTIAFWSRLPVDVLPAGAALSWRLPANPKGTPRAQIAWNQDPAAGAVGALRTDYGPGFVVGTRPLLDGQWHHIAVTFVPDPKQPGIIHVKQYVDGRLEPVSSRRGSHIRLAEADPAAKGDGAADLLWIGRGRWSASRPDDRLRATLDEIVIADRALAPRDIVHWIQNNTPPPPHRPAEASAKAPTAL